MARVLVVEDEVVMVQALAKGDLGLTLTSTSAGGSVEAQLALADPHGDTVATVPVPASGAAVGIEGWVDHDEYGNPLGQAAPVDGAVTDGLGYGWLGAKEPATLDTGLMLMGPGSTTASPASSPRPTRSSAAAPRRTHTRPTPSTATTWTVSTGGRSGAPGRGWPRSRPSA